MKKKIIMIGIILISTTSLLLVIFCIKTKNIKYISSNEIGNYSNISMTINGVNATTTPNSGYYKLQASCENGSVSWSNSNRRLKVKVTNSPLKCTLAFTEVTEDVNLVAIYVDNVEITGPLQNGIDYFLYDYECKDNNNTQLENVTVTYDYTTKAINIIPLTNQIYCRLNFVTEAGYVATGDWLTKAWKFATYLAGENVNLIGNYTDFRANVNGILESIGNSTNAMRYLASNTVGAYGDDLLTDLKTYDNYSTEIYEYLLGNAELTDEERYAGKLPFYAYKFNRGWSRLTGDIAANGIARTAGANNHYYSTAVNFWAFRISTGEYSLEFYVSSTLENPYTAVASTTKAINLTGYKGIYTEYIPIGNGEDGIIDDATDVGATCRFVSGISKTGQASANIYHENVALRVFNEKVYAPKTLTQSGDGVQTFDVSLADINFSIDYRYAFWIERGYEDYSTPSGVDCFARIQNIIYY